MQRSYKIRKTAVILCSAIQSVGLVVNGGGLMSELTLLVVEDEAEIAASLSEALSREGFEIQHAATGRDALEAEMYDLVLLDLGLPDLDGLEVCRRLRSRSAVPIIVLTARAEEIDRVMGLEVGADDYVVKPFSMRELVARIRAVQRRVNRLTVPPEHEPAQHIGPLVLDRRSRRTVFEGTEIELTAKEFDLLAYLAEQPGVVFTRQTLLTELWDPHWYGPTKTVDVHVASIRRKLGNPDWIETIRGVGFRLGCPFDVTEEAEIE